MADKPLIWLPFLLYRNTPDDGGRVIKDPAGFFYCKASTVRFLDIPESAIFVGALKKERASYTRTKVLVDGTILGGTDQMVATGYYTIKPSPNGASNPVILKSGKKTSTGKSNHTLTFSFPSWADAATIAEALGELIPSGKISINPGNTEIYPYFKYPRGGTVPIMSKDAATASTRAEVGLNPQLQLALAQKVNAQLFAYVLANQG